MSIPPDTELGGQPVAELLQRVVATDWPRMLAPLVRMLGDVSRGEDALQDAIVAALDRWPIDGVPREPRAWLITAAKRRAIDRLRRERRRPDLEREAARTTPTWSEAEALPMPFGDPAQSEASVDDDVLRLVYLCCHPALSQDAQAALALRLLGGLTTAEIARAYLVPEATMAKRLGRAKDKIARATIPFAVPPADELSARTAGVAATVYLMFNEGYSATAGAALLRSDLIDEAIRLAELVHGLLPREPAILGVLSLMLFQDARRATRAEPGGELVLLRDQDRSQWDAPKIRRAVELLGAGLSATPARPDPYVVQAAIAACHALAPDYEATQWAAIVSWYDVLLTVQDTPVVHLNRAAAVAEASGPQAGLAAMEAIEGLDAYPLWYAARAELLGRLARPAEAQALLRTALELPLAGPLRAHLVARLAAMAD